MRNSTLLAVDEQPIDVQVEHDIVCLYSMACMVHDRLMSQLGSSTNDNARIAMALACMVIEKSRDLEIYYALATRNQQMN